MTVLTTQKKLDLQLDTKLGKDKLIVEELTVDEYLHDLFNIKIIAHSADIDIDLNASLGKPMTVCLNTHDGKRYFSGVVARFEQIHTTVLDKKKKLVAFYHIQLVPKFWLLKQSKDYRIFQNKSVQDIIKLLMGENKITDFAYTAKKGASKKREFCVQYGESHYDFIVRLCEEEGVFFYIEHKKTTHKLHFVDAASLPKKLEKGEFPYAQKTPSAMLMNTIYECISGEQVTGAKLKTIDYNYLKPKVPLKGETAGKGVGGTYFNYPGLFDEKADGDIKAKDLFASLNWGGNNLHGSSTAPALVPFQSFKMKNHPRKSLNAEYVVYRVQHKVSQTQLTNDSGEAAYDRIYENKFWAYPAKAKCKPALTQEKPRIHSLQTATVTGPEGEEIYTDKYGRVKVKFHWDSRGKEDDKSSCWIRVAQNWAGSQWGGLILPRIGMEVVVSFMDGDPDRPLVMGCVYNGEKLPPYASEEPTVSTFKTSSSKGDKGNNELRFDDKADKEEVYIHAQKDMNIVIENERTEEIVEKDDTLTIKAGNKTEILEGSGTKYKVEIKDGDRELEITKGKHKITLTAGDQILEIKKGDQKVTIGQGNSEMTLTQGDAKITLAGGDLTIMVTGKISLTSTGDMDFKSAGKLMMNGVGGVMIMSGANMACQAAANFAIQAGANIPIVAGANLTVTAAANAIIGGGANVIVNGGANTMIKGGANIVMDAGAMFQMKGTIINATAQGAANIIASGPAVIKGATVILG